MAFSPLGFVGGIGKKALGAIDDTFSGETVDPYKPDKSDYYAGSGSGFFDEGKAAQDKKAPQADLTGYNQMRGLGLQSREALANWGKGYDPNNSLGAAQLRQGQDANMRQALALARSGGGSGAAQAQAMRQAQFTSAQQGQQVNQQAAVIRSQEQMDHMRMGLQAAIANRQMDLQAQGLDAQTAMQQAQLEMQQRGLNNQMQLGLYGIGAGYDMANQQGNIAYHQLMGQQQLGAGGLNAQLDAQRDASLAGLLGTVGGGLLIGGLSDVRGKTDIAPIGGGAYDGLSGAVGGIFESLGRKRDERERMLAAPGYGGAGDPYQRLDLYSDPISDRQSKEQIQALERRNSALETALASVTRGSGTGGTFDRERLQAAPGMRRQLAPEETVARARAEELERRNEVMGALRRQMGEEAMEAAAVEQYERDTARTRAQDQRIMNAAEAARQGAADIYFRPNPPGVTQPTPPGAGVVSDRESKREISALRAALDRVRDEQIQGLRGSEPTSRDLDRVRDEQISGIRGTPTRRFDDVPPAVRAQADLPAYTFRYREPFAQQYGGERRVGVMAQDLERNPLYAPAVKTGPDGLKRVDAGQATMANIAADAELARIVEDQERRLRAVESLPPFAKPRGF